MSISLSRRSLLQALTVGAGSLAFGPGRLGGGIARAGTGGVPGRVIIFPIGLGGGFDPSYDNYLVAPSLPGPDGGGNFAATGTTTDFTLGPILQPFGDMGLQDQLVYIRGLGYPIGWYGEAHISGAVAMLTGTATADQQPDGSYTNIRPANQSIDQYLAKKIGTGMQWPWLGMQLSASPSIDANLNGVYGFGDPITAYNQVFGNLTDSGPDPTLLRRLARRKTTLDAVSKDVAAFTKRLPVEDRMRAESQIAAIQAMEAQLTAQMSGSTCAKPTMAPSDDYSNPVNLPDAVRGFSDIAVAALACDLTRVVSITMTCQYSSMATAYAPVNQPNASHHPLSHGTDDSGTGSSDSQNAWQTERQFFHQLAAELAQKLQKIPEGGGTMLDNTIILIPSENGVASAHNFTDLCWLTVGGKGLGVKTGQVMQLSQRVDYTGNYVPPQRLFVSILNALGVSDQTFNDDGGTGSGPLSGYLA